MKELVAAVIKNDEGKILITKSFAGDMTQQVWKFPGGKIDIGETDEEALTRKIKEELSIEISINNYLAENSFKNPEETVNLIAYDAQLEYGKVKLAENKEYKWVKKDELDKLNFSLLDEFIIKAIYGEEKWN